MPKSARIMRRGNVQVNGRATTFRRLVLAFATGVLLALVTACGDDRAADKLYREGSEQVAKGDTRAAVATFERILREFPESEAAAKARRDISVYRGLAEAVERFPQRRAREILVQTGRALERYHASTHRWPVSLVELVPEHLDREPLDPWSRPLGYRARPGGSGYEMTCLGADGSAGGEGDDADLRVVNGSFVGEAK